MPLPSECVPDSDLEDLARRLARTRAPRLTGENGWSRGIDAAALAALLDRWRDGFDWRVHERRILDLPWEEAAGLRVVHQRSIHPGAPTVALLHGWPDSVLRYERVLPLLRDVNVVVPALPGFPFAAEASGMDAAAMAALVADALASLGYGRYVLSGGDLGGDVAEQLAARHPDRVGALHLTNVSPLHVVFADRSTLDAEGLAYVDAAARWSRAEGAYIAVQSSRPHTLAVALSDSPAGLAAWLFEKLHGWSDEPFAVDDLLLWISAYWFTNSIGSSFTTYAEAAKPVPYVSTPTVLSLFAADTKPAPVGFAARFVNVQEVVAHERGGHFAAWEQPEAYAQDVRRAMALAGGRR